MGNLATLQPILSPMLWTSIATGKRAYKHGIHGFAEPDPRTGTASDPSPISDESPRRSGTSSTRAAGARNVIGWWPSHPAEPISGVMVSNHYQQAVAPLGKPWSMRPGTVHPPRLAEALAGISCPSGGTGSGADPSFRSERREDRSGQGSSPWAACQGAGGDRERSRRRDRGDAVGALGLHGGVLRRHRSLLPWIHEVPPAPSRLGRQPTTTRLTRTWSTVHTSFTT